MVLSGAIVKRTFWLDRGWYIAWNAGLVVGAIALARVVLVRPLLRELKTIREGRKA